MITFDKSLQAWRTHGFGDPFRHAIKSEIAALGTTGLPLQQGLSHSSVALDDPVSANILSCADEGKSLSIKAGIFYTGIIAGCSCADDPTPTDVCNEYCEVMIDIDKDSSAISVTLLTDDD